MVIYIGGDHRGFRIKEVLKADLLAAGYEVVDCGAAAENPDDDYTEFASAVAEKVSHEADTARGILICGSGVGVDVTANKFKKVRSALGFSNDQVYSARHDDDANVLSLAADFTDEAAARAMTKIFVETPFGTDDRFRRRIDKILQIEHA
jgi:ribose 5-phosphate isomerase B